MEFEHANVAYRLQKYFAVVSAEARPHVLAEKDAVWLGPVAAATSVVVPIVGKA